MLARTQTSASNEMKQTVRRNPLMTPLLPSVIRMEWTA
jgi:hypothetical protein